MKTTRHIQITVDVESGFVTNGLGLSNLLYKISAHVPKETLLTESIPMEIMNLRMLDGQIISPRIEIKEVESSDSLPPTSWSNEPYDTSEFPEAVVGYIHELAAMLDPQLESVKERRQRLIELLIRVYSMDLSRLLVTIKKETLSIES